MNEKSASGRNPVATLSIAEGYRPGLIGEITALHAVTYSQSHGFGRAFECKVASELADFVTRLDRPGNRIWYVADRGQTAGRERILGSVAIDGEDLGGDRAHLRWFIVDASCRGLGIGRRLLEQALDFVEQGGFDQTRLWTLSGLDAARSLYEHAGFVLLEEYDGDQWGVRTVEQTFGRPSRSS